VSANPAKLSPTLSRLFPSGTLAAELRDAGDPASLLPAEAKVLKRAVPERVQEFAAGRLCARLLLAEFGIVDFAVEAGEARQPLWPAALVGSITHTAGFCAAVVAERTLLRAVGLDSEVVGTVKAELWPSICVPCEIDWLESLPQLQQAMAATLIFSAKEAFYKCQYPLVRERLGFHDARVEVAKQGLPGGAFAIHFTKPLAIAEYAALPLQCRYLFHEQFVTVGIAVDAAMPAQ
jgi:4'-phosphopantetheinyl transferase EntD